MKRVLYASVIAMGCTIAVAAQSGMAAPQAPEKDKMSKDAAKTVTATGCVAEADGHYMLNNATMGDMAGSPMSYAITGENFKPHVGHKIEVTGTMKPMSKDMKKDSMAKDKDAMAKAPMAKDDMKKDMAAAGSLTVKSMKMIAATCS